MKNDLHLHLDIDGTLWNKELPSPCLVMVQWGSGVYEEDVLLTVSYKSERTQGQENNISSITIHPKERNRIIAALSGNNLTCDCRICRNQPDFHHD